jgi:tetratricopeptide (TPR) repeat protein
MKAFRSGIRIAAFALAGVIAVVGCTGSQRTPTQSKPGQTTKQAPTELRAWWKSARAKMEDVLHEQGREPVDLESPKWFENSYNMLGRMPLIDTAMREPLAMPEIAMWADDEARKNGDSLYGLANLAYQLAEQTSGKMPGETPYADPVEIERFTKLLETSGDVPKEIASIVRELFASAFIADLLRNQAFSQLNETERKRTAELLPGYFVKNSPEGEIISGYTTDLTERVELLDILQKVLFNLLEQAAYVMADAADKARQAIQKLSIGKMAANKPILFDKETAIGRVIIGGTGPNTYTEDAAIIIDLGGDDVYLNHAAATSLDGPGVSVLIDVSGNDTYKSDGFSQSCAMCGVSVLMDLAGDDKYISGHYSQGAALCGFSFFYEGGGDDVYVGDLGVQCFAMFGYSIFAERGGRDTYRCGSMGQGCASTLGVAILAEGGGDDSYRAGGKQGFYSTWDASCAQGAASGMRDWPPAGKISVYGGIGFLSEASGNDNYEIYVIGQGGSYVHALGMLVDSEGDDIYNHSRYGCGVGVHCSGGVCVDKAGDDVHNGFYGNLGYDLDRSSGVFVDFAGNDVYRSSGSMGFGHKPKGTGVFFDRCGDDTYVGLGMNFGLADIQFGDDMYSAGFYLTYNPDKYVNNKSWAEGEFGFGEDGEVENPTVTGEGWWKPRDEASLGGLAEMDIWTAENATDLLFPSPLVRFTALKIVSESPDKGIEAICLASKSDSTSVRRHLIDVIQAINLRKILKPKHCLTLAPMLDSPDHDMRLLALWAMRAQKFADPDVMQKVAKLATDDPQYEVRSMACLALGTSNIEQALPPLLAALKDPHWRVRRRAAMGLGELKNSKSFDALVEALKNDPAYQVRGYAADDIGKLEISGAVGPLENALQDKSEFVRCQAARALLTRFNRKDAMDELIKLMTWSNGVLREQWLTNFLTDYTGQAFPAEVKPWQDWWGKAGKTFDPKAQCAMLEKLNGARVLKAAGDEDAALAIYREIRKDWPNHRGAAMDAAEILNAKAWRFVLSGKEYAKGLELATECVMADTQTMYLDTRAVLFYLNGDKENAMKTIRQAIEKSNDSERPQYEGRLKEFETGKLKL